MVVVNSTWSDCAQGLTTLGHKVESLLSSHVRMDKIAELLRPWAVVHREPYTNTYDRRLRLVGALLDRPLITHLANRFREIRPDIIHINKQNVEDGLDLVAAASKTGLPFLSTIHITRPPNSLGAWGGSVRGGIARLALKRSSTPCLAIARQCGTS